MKLIWLIVFIALSFLPMIFGKKKAQNIASANEAEDESGEEMQEDSFFNFGETEAEEVVAPEPNTYFTYEDPKVEVSHESQEVSAVTEETQMPAFDLRSAIVYQTVLTNKYTSLENQ